MHDQEWQHHSIASTYTHGFTQPVADACCQLRSWAVCDTADTLTIARRALCSNAIACYTATTKALHALRNDTVLLPLFKSVTNRSRSRLLTSSAALVSCSLPSMLADSEAHTSVYMIK